MTLKSIEFALTRGHVPVFNRPIFSPKFAKLVLNSWLLSSPTLPALILLSPVWISPRKNVPVVIIKFLQKYVLFRCVFTPFTHRFLVVFTPKFGAILLEFVSNFSALGFFSFASKFVSKFWVKISVAISCVISKFGVFKSVFRILILYWSISICTLEPRTAGPLLSFNTRNWSPEASVISPICPPSASSSFTKCPFANPPIAGLQLAAPLCSHKIVIKRVLAPILALAKAASHPACPAPITMLS